MAALQGAPRRRCASGPATRRRRASPRASAPSRGRQEAPRAKAARQEVTGPAHGRDDRLSRPAPPAPRPTAPVPACAAAAAGGASRSSTPTASASTTREVLTRISELVIPPAWKDVWICPYPERPHPGDRRSTPPGASSTSTTRAGARGATRRSSTRCSTSRARCRGCASASSATSAPRRLSPRARARLRRAAARPRLLPHRLRGLRGAERDLRARDDAQAPRADLAATALCFDYLAKSGKRRVQAVVDPDGGGGRRARSSGAAAAATSCSPTRRGRALGRREVRRHQRVPQGGHRRRLLRQGLPHLGRDGAGGGRRSPCRPRRADTETAPQARRRARGQGGRALPRQHARRSRAPPTSTRACSTATRTASRSRACSTEIGRRPATTRRSRARCEEAVLDLIDGPATRRARGRRPDRGDRVPVSLASAADAAVRSRGVARARARPVRGPRARRRCNRGRPGAARPRRSPWRPPRDAARSQRETHGRLEPPDRGRR